MCGIVNVLLTRQRPTERTSHPRWTLSSAPVSVVVSRRVSRSQAQADPCGVRSVAVDVEQNIVCKVIAKFHFLFITIS